MADPIRFAWLGCQVEVRCADAELGDLLRADFQAMEPGGGAEPDLVYRVARDPDGGIRLGLPGDAPPLRPASSGDLVYQLEAHLVVALQRRRSELLFLHAAAVERGGKAYLLVGRSGAGKSTTCWGLLGHGFRYLSDELAPLVLPVDADGGAGSGSGPFRVLGYPHALCLKRAPPPDHPAPPGARRSTRGLHIPPPGSAPGAGPVPVAAVLLVGWREGRVTPSLRPVPPGEAAVHLYPNVLNALAHHNDGLAAVAALAGAVPAYRLEAAGLGATCRLVARELPFPEGPAGP